LNHMEMKHGIRLINNRLPEIGSGFVGGQLLHHAGIMIRSQKT
jgi:hypothetical protein